MVLLLVLPSCFVTSRAGFLFGRYVPHKDIPLGITAVIEALYEPPQVNSPQGLQVSGSRFFV